MTQNNYIDKTHNGVEYCSDNNKCMINRENK